MSAENSKVPYIVRAIGLGTIAFGAAACIGGDFGVLGRIDSAINHKIDARIDDQLNKRGITLSPNQSIQIGRDNSTDESDLGLFVAGMGVAVAGAFAVGPSQAVIESRNSVNKSPSTP